MKNEIKEIMIIIFGEEEETKGRVIVLPNALLLQLMLREINNLGNSISN